jgi:ribosomal protein S27E
MDDAGWGDDRRLDGNAAGGLLREIFEVEMTTVEVVCRGCGGGGPLGAAIVYAHGMGTVVRCASCGLALIRVAQLRGVACVDIGGTAGMRAEDEEL